MNVEDRDKLVTQLTERCELIEKVQEPFAPIVFFVEGSVTNGTVLSKPRRGAFIPLKPITPMFLEYEYYSISPSYDCILGLELFILSCSSCLFAT